MSYGPLTLTHPAIEFKLGFWQNEHYFYSLYFGFKPLANMQLIENDGNVMVMVMISEVKDCMKVCGSLT